MRQPETIVRTAGLLVCLAALISCGSVRPVTDTSQTQACRVADGLTPRQCPLMGSDADWLPPAYVRNATCRCQASPNSPTANCVRGGLDEMLRSTPKEIRAAWREKKRTLHDAGRHEEYERWLVEDAGRALYRLHKKAHSRCCCPSALPAYREWSRVVTTPLADCRRERVLRAFGGCRAADGRW